MKYYTLIDLSCARDIKSATIGDDTLEADRLIYAEWQAWADDVINWFKALFKVARLFHNNWINDWQLSLKAVWQSIKAMKYTKQLFKLLRKVRRLATDKAVTTIRRYKHLRVSKRDPELLSCRGRVAKSNLRIKRAQDANFKQSVTVKQSWQ